MLIYHNYLLQNFPNPCNETTTISYTIANNENVSLFGHNSIGEKIETLVNDEIQIVENYQVELNMSNYEVGAYFLVLSTSNHITSK